MGHRRNKLDTLPVPHATCATTPPCTEKINLTLSLYRTPCAMCGTAPMHRKKKTSHFPCAARHVRHSPPCTEKTNLTLSLCTPCAAQPPMHRKNRLDTFPARAMCGTA